MDVRHLLRRYLEQRRELGESELVLDTLSVEEVLRLVGAPAERAAPARAAAAGDGAAAAATDADTSAQPSDADWRAILRAAGGAPGNPPDRQAARGERDPRPEAAPTREEPPAAPPATAPPTTEASTTESSAGPDSDLAALAPAGITAGTPSRDLFQGPLAHLATLDAIAAEVAKCTRCPLARGAKNPVPGEGNPRAKLVCVGEAPGATEDETGRPFVGQAGQLLTKILEAIKLAREDVFICNVLKHRPPGNRNPLPDEVAACSPFLVRQLELIQPSVIIAFGTFAAQTLLNTRESLGKLRGVIHRYYGTPLIVTYHPAALLRNPNWKRPTWDDVKLARRILDRAAGT